MFDLLRQGGPDVGSGCHYVDVLDVAWRQASVGRLFSVEAWASHRSLVRIERNVVAVSEFEVEVFSSLSRPVGVVVVDVTTGAIRHKDLFVVNGWR